MSSKKNIVCPLCQRRFASKAGLAQHRSDSHAAQKPAASKGKRSVGTRGPNTTSMPGMTSSGVDLVQTLMVTARRPTGTVLLNLPIGPSHLVPSRLRNESALWSRWRPKALRVSIVGSGAATTFGSVCVAWCPDFHWTPTGNSSDYMRVAALRPSVTMRLHESRVLTIPMDTTTKWYLCDGSTDMSTHGSLLAVIAAPVGGFTGSLGLTLTLEWVVQFEGIEMPGIGGAVSDAITPDVGWTNLFTTSDGSFDATHLTMKMHSGGAMAPFSAARPDHVYAPDEGTTVQYYDSAGKTQVCSWFAVVKNYDVPGLLLFGSREDAEAYVQTGVIAKALPYVKAGPVITPPVPRFVGSPVQPKAELGSQGPGPGVLQAFWRGKVTGSGADGSTLVTWRKGDWELISSFFEGYKPFEEDFQLVGSGEAATPGEASSGS